MRRLEWAAPALDDLKAAGEYIVQDNPTAARRMASRVIEAVELLQDQPNLGRPGRLADTKELVVSGTPFVVVYRVRKGDVHIIRLLHHSLRWP
ncbi:MAG: type II toxin-antitoxin system RelE/ParE family toxin [Desulfurivibrionaceae bacterium]